MEVWEEAWGSLGEALGKPWRSLLGKLDGGSLGKTWGKLGEAWGKGLGLGKLWGSLISIMTMMMIMITVLTHLRGNDVNLRRIRVK